MNQRIARFGQIGTVLAVSLTVLIIAVIALFSVAGGDDAAAAPEADAATVIELVLPTVAAAAEVDSGALQAAFAARESLLLAQIEELDSALAERQAGYQTRSEELTTLINTGAATLAQLQQQAAELGAQIEQLQAAETERATAYDQQRGQAYYQYQTTINALRAQLDEANAKLAEANAQLGR